MFIGGFAAAALILASDRGSVDARGAGVQAAQEAYKSCILTHAAQMYRGRDTQRLEQAIAEACSGELQAWTDVLTAAASPQARAAAIAGVQPMLSALVHMAVAVGALNDLSRGPAPAVTDSESVTRSAPDAEPEDGATPTPTIPLGVPAKPGGRCGGITVPTDPSALSC
jgi:hypothetical protein